MCQNKRILQQTEEKRERETKKIKKIKINPVTDIALHVLNDCKTYLSIQDPSAPPPPPPPPSSSPKNFLGNVCSAPVLLVKRKPKKYTYWKVFKQESEREEKKKHCFIPCLWQNKASARSVSLELGPLCVGWVGWGSGWWGGGGGGVVRWMSWDQLASVVELGISALWFWPKFR